MLATAGRNHLGTLEAVKDITREHVWGVCMRATNSCRELNVFSFLCAVSLTKLSRVVIGMKVKAKRIVNRYISVISSYF